MRYAFDQSKSNSKISGYLSQSVVSLNLFVNALETILNP